MDMPSPIPWERPPVIIIGAHRSGTTATAHALQLLGLHIGVNLDSHAESRLLQRLHEQYLFQFAAAWHDPVSFLNWIETDAGRRQCTVYLRDNLESNYAGIFGYPPTIKGLLSRARLRFGAPWGWKEPRTTLFGRCWLNLFPDARFVHVARHPWAAALSIRQRELEFRKTGDSPNIRLDDLEYCTRLVATYVETGERLAAATPNYQLVRFEDIQADPAKTLAALADFCGLPFTEDKLAEAASSIRPEKPFSDQDLPPASVQAFLSGHPIFAKLGYK